MTISVGMPMPLAWECPWCHARNPRAHAGKDNCWTCGAVVLTTRVRGAGLRVANTTPPSSVFQLPTYEKIRR
jgi:hypothetical protein